MGCSDGEVAGRDCEILSMIFDMSISLAGFFFLSVGMIVSVLLFFQSRSVFFPLLFLWHSASAIVYCAYSINNPADAKYYYSAELREFALGTDFVHYLTIYSKNIFFASYLDLFFLFSLFGFFGLSLLYSALIGFCNRRESVVLLWVVMFLPGLSFWTSAIGKDSLVFFALSLLVFSFLKKGRWFYFLASVSLILVFLVRPHIVMMLIFSFALASFFSSGLSLSRKLTSLFLIAPIVVLLMPYVMEYVGLNELSLESAESYVETRQSYNQVGGGAVDLSSHGPVYAVFSYMFRPLFVDANGLLPLMASFENVVYLFMFSYAAHSILVRRVSMPSAGWFFLCSTIFLWLVLGVTTSNLGIALRQKLMIFPFYVSLFFLFLGLEKTDDNVQG